MKTQKNDIIKFAEKYAYAYNPFINRIEKIKLFKYQKQMLKSFEKNRFTIIKQSRQVGIDTVVAIYVAYLMSKSSEKEILIISDSVDSARHFLTKVKTILIHAEIKLVTDNQKEIRLENMSRVVSIGGSIEAGKGCALDLLFINNFEYVKYSDDIWAACGLALSCTEGKAILASTPKYKKDFFYKLWTDAVKKKNDFKPINVNWKKNPNFDEAWYKKQCLMLFTQDAISTELDGKFISRKDKKRKAAINIRVDHEKKAQILNRMKQKNISSITDYIMELINRDLSV